MAQRKAEDRSCRVKILSAGAGVGKTVIMSKLSENESVAAMHFCRHDDERKRDPRYMLRSLAFQLAERVPAYRAALEAKQLTKDALDECKGAKSLFGLLFKELMEGLEAPEDGTRLVILIDALDECEHGRENKILDCISKDFASLPSWLGVFITTRPEVDIWKKLEKFNPSVIVPESEKNMADLRIFFAHALDGMLTSEEERAEAASILAEKSGGIFIYAKYAVERLRSEKGGWTLEKIHDFPAGLDDFYEEQFRRICGEGGEKSTAFKFASLIVVAREPLEVDALQAMVGCERRERLQAVARLSVLFPIHDRKMKVNHKSVKDWLTNEERCDEELYIDVKECDKRIAEKCLASLREGNEVVGPYALRQGIAHMLSAGMVNEARETVMRFAWYVERAKVKEWNGVLEDLGRMRAALPEDRCVKLLESAARLSAGHVRREPLEVAGQMHARLMGYGDVLSDFLEEVLA